MSERSAEAQLRSHANALSILGDDRQASLYLDRCRVDTPISIVRLVWKLALARKKEFGKVVDFGAGDGRFGRTGVFTQYVGYEIDPTRCDLRGLPATARIINACAFSDHIDDASLCIGNPPFVRNQDLPIGWRQRAAQSIHERIGVEISGLANAWQYFFFLALASTKEDGIVALVIPYEWVSRPSSSSLRDFIKAKGWRVSIYRLTDRTFARVLTTSSVTIVDKRGTDRSWTLYRQLQNGTFKEMRSPTGGRRRPLEYERRSKADTVAKRGLSPGTQEYLTLTEGERVRCGLKTNNDVVPCITTLRTFPSSFRFIDEARFKRYFVETGLKCWLVRTDKRPSSRLSAYLASIPEGSRATATCEGRDIWWKFAMPSAPAILIATGFRGKRPKAVRNLVKGRAVGAVSGVYCKARKAAAVVLRRLRELDLTERIVSHSNGLRKLETNQINAALSSTKK